MSAEDSIDKRLPCSLHVIDDEIKIENLAREQTYEGRSVVEAVVSKRRRTSNGVHHAIANFDVRFRTDDCCSEGH